MAIYRPTVSLAQVGAIAHLSSPEIFCYPSIVGAYRIRYVFTFADGRKRDYGLVLDTKDLSLLGKQSDTSPDWTRLGYKQCTCCPLDPTRVSHCSIAVNLADLVEEFKDDASIEMAQVAVYTEDRIYVKKTAVQHGLFSMFGIVMATSGCPIMNIFKPMARYHLPFSTVEETIVRSTAFYLLRQFVNRKRGREADFDLQALRERYQQVSEVNQGMLARIRHLIDEGDADLNAIVILNSFAQFFELEHYQDFRVLEDLFDEE